MRLYCLRHGEAEADLVDHDRILNEQGRLDVSRLGERLAQLDVHINKIYHSGVVRAEQTAQIIAEKLKFTSDLTVMPELFGGGGIALIADMIQHWQDDSLLVSHMPFVSELVSYLVTGQSHQTLMAFPPATLALLERVKPGIWRLLSILPPSVLVK
ncbi:MAG: phosphohistidine phosphatase SixA [Gammaproteobacteria bacterium RIFCSPHIGHO2_12_FULL_41_15]|nr:MAG: phosphohistidine phosphatase SixA [Gammaproteobacteria bacterium RIFCSPHIGHO2_12_FULL_41_15]